MNCMMLRRGDDSSVIGSLSLLLESNLGLIS